MLVLATVLVIRRREPDWSHSLIPRGATPALALVGFLPTALGLIGIGVDRVVVNDGRGAGMWFADGSVSLLAAVVCFGTLLWQVVDGRAERRRLADAECGD